MALPSLRLADSTSALGEAHRGCVLVTGSHGGLVAARQVLDAGVRAVVFNDAGGGRHDAGVAGLDWLARSGIPAAAVSHLTARIGDAHQTMSGMIARTNPLADAVGVYPGERCRDAVERLRAAGELARQAQTADEPPTARAALRNAAGAPSRRQRPPVPARAAAAGAGDRRYVLSVSPEVRGLDSVDVLLGEDAGCILVIGSHCELHGGDPTTALAVDARAAFYHDAGFGELPDGCTRLPVLAARAIPAAAVDYRTACIGDAQSMWDTGRLSAINEPGRLCGWRAGLPVRVAAVRLHR